MLLKGVRVNHRKTVLQTHPEEEARDASLDLRDARLLYEANKELENTSKRGLDCGHGSNHGLLLVLTSTKNHIADQMDILQNVLLNN